MCSVESDQRSTSCVIYQVGLNLGNRNQCTGRKRRIRTEAFAVGSPSGRPRVGLALHADAVHCRMMPACCHSIALRAGDLRGNRHSISMVFAQPKLETSFEYQDVRNRIVIDNGFNPRPLHRLCGGVIENENRVTRGLPKKALKLRDWHSEGIGDLQYFARSSARTQLNDDQIWFNHNERIQTFWRNIGKRRAALHISLSASSQFQIQEQCVREHHEGYAEPRKRQHGSPPLAANEAAASHAMAIAQHPQRLSKIALQFSSNLKKHPGTHFIARRKHAFVEALRQAIPRRAGKCGDCFS